MAIGARPPNFYVCVISNYTALAPYAGGQHVVPRNKTNGRTRTYRQLRHTKADCRRGMYNERKSASSH
jgi:hypothetical protein